MVITDNVIFCDELGRLNGSIITQCSTVSLDLIALQNNPL